MDSTTWPSPSNYTHRSGSSTSSLVNRFTLWDYLVFCGTLAVSSCIGVYYAFYGSRKVSTDEFLMGGRSMKVFPVALSILASFMSAITLLGTAAEMYMAGTQYVLICVSYCFVIPATAYFYMPVFHHLQLTSAYEYLEIRFNQVIRSMGSAIFSMQMLIYMAIVLYAPALALSQVTGISTWTSVLSLGIVCTFYTSIGGIKAVVWADVFQIGLMFGSMVTLVVEGTKDLGGLGYVFGKASEGGRLEFFNMNPSPTERHTVFGVTIGTFFTWMSVYAVNQAMVQRYLTIPTVQGARAAIWINLPGLTFLMLICAMAGLAMYAQYYDCDPIMTKKVTAPDQLLPLYVMEILGEYKGLPGLFVSGIFSGALSTVSSGVNSLAAVTMEDVIRRYIIEDMSERGATNLTQMLALAFGCTAIALVYAAEKMGNVLQAALSIFGIVGGPLLGVFTLGIFFPFANNAGAAVGVLTSLTVTMWIGIGAFYFKPATRKARFSVMGCLQEYINVTHQRAGNVTFPTPPDPDVVNARIWYVFRISYVWYSMIACMIVVTVGIIVSLLTGPNEPHKVNPRVIHPIYNYVVKKLLPPGKREMFMVKSESDYDRERMIALGRRKSTQRTEEAIGVTCVAGTGQSPAQVSTAVDTASNVSIDGSASVAQTKDRPTTEGAGGPVAPSTTPLSLAAIQAKSSSPAPSETFDVALSKAGSPAAALTRETDSKNTPAPTADPGVTSTLPEEHAKDQQDRSKSSITQEQEATKTDVADEKGSLTAGDKASVDKPPAAKSE